MIKYHNINGELVAAEEATVSIKDIGLLRGYGIFDFFPIRFGLPVFARDYFDRFYRSAELMGLEVPVSRQELHDRIVDLAHANGITRGYMKLVLTGGNASDGYTPAAPNLYVVQHNDITYDESWYEKGLRLVLQKYLRDEPEIKTLDYANVLKHRQVLQETGALDILYHDGQYIHETSRANFFIVDQDNIIHTTVDTALSGITRRHLIRLAREHGMHVKEALLPIHKTVAAKEAFISSTTKGAMPVTMINDYPIGDGRVGPVCRELRKWYDELLAQKPMTAFSPV